MDNYKRLNLNSEANFKNSIGYMLEIRAQWKLLVYVINKSRININANDTIMYEKNINSL